MPPLIAITRAIPLRGAADAPSDPAAPPPPVIRGASVRMAPALPQLSRAQLLEFVRGADAVVSMFHDRVDAEFLAAAGPQLKGVCNFAVGFDNIDLGACRERGVIVTNTPDAVTEGTANMSWALLLAAARRLCEGDRFVRSGRFEHEGNTFPTGWLGRHLTGQVLHIVGAGRIGRAVALRAQAFGMRVVYTARSRHLDFEQAPIAARRVELEEGLRMADVVSIHTPLTPETRHLISAARLAMMKPEAILINTSRGPTVDEAALAAALRSRRIWAAGLDVFEHEPRVHPDLLTLDNVVLTPHIGSGERHWREEMSRIACENAAAIVSGRPAPNAVG
ncbi:MAG: D-glycerate dehydrogenase [Phycisphaerales bacterium]|nr:D-glycerate dehydrogenase [Phycisphaerales bacterium]